MKKSLLLLLFCSFAFPIPAPAEGESSGSFGSDPCDFATPSSPVWVSIVMKMRARSRYGGIVLSVYEDGEHFVLLPRASVSGYNKGIDFGTVREIIAPAEARDMRLKEMSLPAFAALHKDVVVLVPPDRVSVPASGKLNILVDSYNLPIENQKK